MERLLGLLSFAGRLSRLQYWRSYLLLSICTAIVWCVGLFAILAVGTWGAVLLIPMPAVALAFMAIAIRRLHDRGLSGWWAVPLVWLPLFMGFAANAGWMNPGAAVLLGLFGLVLTIWGWVEIGFRRGTTGPNRYGPEPDPA